MTHNEPKITAARSKVSSYKHYLSFAINVDSMIKYTGICTRFAALEEKEC
jgi:hypothetical protein